MKKQILFMMFLSLALIFAGLKSYGQVDPNVLGAAGACAPVTPLGDCAADGPLNPIPGKPYTYTVDVDPEVGSGNTPGYIQWFVYNATDVPSIIDAGALTTNAEPNDGTSTFLLDAHKVGDVNDKTVYNSTTNTDVSIVVSWQSFNAVDNEILLVAYVMGEDGCSDNIEVWRIEPAFAFTLDIAGLMPDGTLNYDGAPNANECVSPVQEASYDGTNLNMDYGENYVFFTVTAANFVHSWQPTFTASHDGTPASTISEIAWAYDGTSTDENDWHVADENGIADAVTVQATDAGAVGADGECIIVRVLVTHGNVENDVASAVTLTVNGIMRDASVTEGDAYANTTLADLEPGENAPCVHVDDADMATYDLTPRPNITEVNPALPGGAFVPKN